ncbi:MAG: aldo/keto reductase [Phycisphaerales bacterium]
MHYRPLGSTNLKVSVLGFGCAPVASRAGSGQSTRAIRLALDKGVTYFDTADMYGLGGSERILGAVTAGRRDSVVISTKCGFTFSAGLRAVSWVKPLLRPFVTRLKAVKNSAGAIMASQRSQNFEPDYIGRCVDASLGRLGLDAIDLFYLHEPPIAVADRADVFQKLAELKNAGKIRFYGVSSDAEFAARVLGSGGSGISAVQVNAGIVDQQPLATVLPLARAMGVAFIARQPFTNGRVFGNRELLDRLASAGLPTDPAYVASLALRFLRDTPGVSAILPSMMRPEHINANVAAIEQPPLNEQERSVAAGLAAAPAQG